MAIRQCDTDSMCKWVKCSSGGSILALNSYFHLLPRSLFISEMYPVNGAGYSRTLLSWLEVSVFQTWNIRSPLSCHSNFELSLYFVCKFQSSVFYPQALEEKRSMLTGRYGSDFYEGFRLFYIMCAEAFAANSGNEYMCGYYVFEKQ